VLLDYIPAGVLPFEWGKWSYLPERFRLSVRRRRRRRLAGSAARYQRCAAWEQLGCAIESPITQLEFVCASTMPKLPLSHLGLSRVDLDAGGGLDLESYAVVPLVVTTGRKQSWPTRI
jgi:hypothetical protein